MPLFQGLLAFGRHGFKHVVIEDWEQWICFLKKKDSALTFSYFIFSKRTCAVSELNYNFKRFLVCMIFLTTRSVLVFLPGNRSMAWIILVSAFHLSCKFLARL